jgi:hypothetical protein
VSKYKLTYRISYPPFSVFCNFIKEIATMMNDPGLFPANSQEIREPKTPRTFQQNSKQIKPVSVTKTDFKDSVKHQDVTPKKCPIHDMDHTLNECRAFRKKS